MREKCVTRFAPSPSGRLHLGHALAARVAVQEAERQGGICYLRLEDLDVTRCRPEYAGGILQDMAWLGLEFQPEVWVQSHRFAHYEAALERLKALGVVYPCFCSRREVMEEVARMGGAPQGETGEIYPGTCRGMSEGERQARLQRGEAPSWRLDCRRAAEMTGELGWQDERFGEFLCRPELLGDVILARKDCPTSYHLAVVVDDAAQSVTLVTRGEDLLSATGVHRTLQALLGLPVPVWLHHPLVVDTAGKRLAKRDRARSIAEIREAGITPAEVWQKLAAYLPVREK